MVLVTCDVGWGIQGTPGLEPLFPFPSSQQLMLLGSSLMITGTPGEVRTRAYIDRGPFVSPTLPLGGRVTGASHLSLSLPLSGRVTGASHLSLSLSVPVRPQAYDSMRDRPGESLVLVVP